MRAKLMPILMLLLAVMFGHEKPIDTACVKSCTRFVITFADYTVLWVYNLHSETSLLTIESEFIALDHCCRYLFPIIDITIPLSKSIGLPIVDTTMKVSIHEDNEVDLILDRTLQTQFTPRKKYYALKMIWFREQIVKRGINILRIEKVEQLGHMFTKGLLRTSFVHLRKKIFG